jgi:hypothetical protein
MIVLSDGSSLDTIDGITSTPYFHQVCPPAGDTTAYSIVSLSDGAGICDGIVPDSAVIIEIYARPEAGIIQTEDTLCATTVDAAAYAWYTCPTGDILSEEFCFSPSVSGCYCVDVVSVSGCVDTACYTIILTSDDEPSDHTPLHIYPNPSRDAITFDLQNWSDDVCTLILYAPDGRILHTLSAHGGYLLEWTWPNEISAGIYFFKLKQNDIQTTVRVLKMD